MYGPPPRRKRKMKMTGGLRKCIRPFLEHELLTTMECAAPSSYLVRQSWKTFPVDRFRERRVRPLCHLMVRQQTWQESENLDRRHVQAIRLRLAVVPAAGDKPLL